MDTITQLPESAFHSDITPWDYACKFLRFPDNVSPDEVREQIVCGNMHLWHGPGWACVTGMDRERNNLKVFLANGECLGWLAMLPRMVMWAKEQGAAGVDLGSEVLPVPLDNPPAYIHDSPEATQ